jgi:hypothetical protein
MSCKIKLMIIELTVLLSLMAFDYPDYHLWYPQTYFCRTNKDMSDDYYSHVTVVSYSWYQICCLTLRITVLVKYAELPGILKEVI